MGRYILEARFSYHGIFWRHLSRTSLGAVPSLVIPSSKRDDADSKILIAVTSASSSEYIAVSSIFTYDIYQTYFNPNARGKMLINMAHSFVIIYAILLAAFSTGLYCKIPSQFTDRLSLSSVQISASLWAIYT